LLLLLLLIKKEPSILYPLRREASRATNLQHQQYKGDLAPGDGSRQPKSLVVVVAVARRREGRRLLLPLLLHDLFSMDAALAGSLGVGIAHRAGRCYQQ
jgi:hypothetical protein